MGYFWLNTLMFVWAWVSWALIRDSGPHAVAYDHAGAVGGPVCECRVRYSSLSVLMWLLSREFIKREETDSYLGSIQKKWNFVEFLCAHLPLLPTQLTFEPFGHLLPCSVEVLHFSMLVGISTQWEESCCEHAAKKSTRIFRERPNVLFKGEAVGEQMKLKRPKLQCYRKTSNTVLCTVALFLKLLGIGLLFCLFLFAAPSPASTLAMRAGICESLQIWSLQPA